MASTLAAIDDTAGFILDRSDVLGADMTLRVDPRGGDAGGAKVVFREKLVARWLAHAHCKAQHVRGGDVKDRARLFHPARAP
jgi:hypothetical protein